MTLDCEQINQINEISIHILSILSIRLRIRLLSIQMKYLFNSTFIKLLVQI